MSADVYSLALLILNFAQNPGKIFKMLVLIDKLHIYYLEERDIFMIQKINGVLKPNHV